MNGTLVVPLLAGWLAGWLTNYLADILPGKHGFIPPACRKCGTTIEWTDYLLMGACRSCQQQRGVRAWLTLLVGLAASLGLWFFPHPDLGYGLALMLVTYLGTVLVIDAEHRLILHAVSAVGLVIGSITGIRLHGLTATLLGGLAGLLIMLGLYLLGMLFTRLRARRLGLQDDEEAFGFGDVTLGAVLGLVLGWPFIWFGLLAGILASGVVSLVIVLVLMIVNRYRQNALMIFIPMGPFFILTSFLMVFVPGWLRP